MSPYCQQPVFDQTAKFAESLPWQNETGWRFVVKKHDATSLHYDFRLEYKDALKSWVVPRGPCLDPTQARRAVPVNDHEIKYRRFEGMIPAGRYGAGTVLLWDEGFWFTDQDVGQALHEGRLKFQLCGSKLKGSWLLNRISYRPATKQEKWVLVKENDTEAKSLAELDILIAQPLSVLSGKTLTEITSNWVGRNSKSKKPDPNQRFLFPDNLEP